MKILVCVVSVISLLGIGCLPPQLAQDRSVSPPSTNNSVTAPQTEPDAQDQRADNSPAPTQEDLPTSAADEKAVVSEKEMVDEEQPSEEPPTFPTNAPQEEPQKNSQEVVNVLLDSDNFSFAPEVIVSKPGQTIAVTFSTNRGFHTFVIDEINLKKTVKQGEMFTFAAPTTPGNYPIYCDIGSHRANGMEAVLRVAL